MRIVVGLTLLAALAVGCQQQHTTIDLGDQHDERGNIFSKTPIVLHVQQGEHDFHALTGPLPSKDSEHAGVTRFQLRCSSISLNMLEGWIYLIGQYPFGSSDPADFYATGTTMAIESMPHLVRMYLLKIDGKEKVKVELKSGIASPGGSQRKRELKDQSYVTIRETSPNVWQIDWPPKPIKNDPDVAATIKAMHDSVMAQGLSGWPSNLP